MKLEKLNQSLLLVSNFGVLVGIIFLAIEINQNTRVARSSARHAIAESVSSSPMITFQDADAARLQLKFFTGEPMTQVERLQAFSRLYSTMRQWENIHFQFQNGMLTDDEWRGFRLNLKSLFEVPIFKEFWDAEKQFFSSRFQDEVAEILRERELEGTDGSFNYLLQNTSE